MLSADFGARLGPHVADRQDMFVELVCQDDDFVRAEFDAIIAASWPSPPPDLPPSPPRPQEPNRPHPPLRCTSHRGSRWKEGSSEHRQRSRQRSPPG